MVTNLPEICRELGLDEPKCRRLDQIVQDICSGKRPKVRKQSLWQQCIASRRKGKPFDPSAIKELAKEYHAGKCP
jgi:hypothetical protein